VKHIDDLRQHESSVVQEYRWRLWIERGNGLPNNGAYSTILAIDPKTLIALRLGSQQLFISTNGGKKVEPASLSDSTIFSVTFDAERPRRVTRAARALQKQGGGGGISCKRLTTTC